MNEMSKCPVMHGAITTAKSGQENVDWWPNALNLDILRQHDTRSKPAWLDFDYAALVKTWISKR